MPYLICPSCRLEAYSAAGYATIDRCARCDTALTRAGRADGGLRRWRLAPLRPVLLQKEADPDVG